MTSPFKAGAVALATVCVGFFATTLLLPSPRGELRADRGRTRASSIDAPGSPRPASPREDPELRSYALSLEDLQGLSPETPPGTHLELWVTYEPPVTRRVRSELLIREAVLDKIVPALPHSWPPTALILVRNGDIPKLMTAERYGSLSASMVP